MEFRATKEDKHRYTFSITCSGIASPKETEEAVHRGPVEKELMFDKVVTPSDVGKLNRLVIPKQHAERYFPLDPSSTEKGILLNFEDRGGKKWRFRYSYWNSSQSYVITKGWSRFVKEKHLNAGDIVSFQRGVGDSGKNRSFIDWRRRRLENVHQEQQPLASMNNFYHGNLVSRGFNPNVPRVSYGYGNSILYGAGEAMMKKPMVQVKRKVESKRLRLFGVNMECPMTTTESSDEKIQPIPNNNYLHNNHHHGVSVFGTRLLDKGKSTMSFDLGS